jgi:hypothetical protein
MENEKAIPTSLTIGLEISTSNLRDVLLSSIPSLTADEERFL